MQALEHTGAGAAGGTGEPGASPANRHPKGIETMKAIGRNVQLAFDIMVPVEHRWSHW